MGVSKLKKKIYFNVAAYFRYFARRVLKRCSDWVSGEDHDDDNARA